MILYTSSYRKSAKDPRAVSIAGRCPIWYKGKEYKTLAPRYWFFNEYKLGTISEEKYTELYYKEVLDKLDPIKVFDDIGGDGTILLCWEELYDKNHNIIFCHRHICSNWLSKNIKDLEVIDL